MITGCPIESYLSMSKPVREKTTITEIAQLVYPLSADEHDYVVDEIRSRWSMEAEPREPWAKRTELSSGRRSIVLEIEGKVLQLADALALSERDELFDELKLVWLRRALDEGEESLRLHGGIPAEEVFAELQQRATDRLKKRGK